MYVAITRAKERLYLTRSKRRFPYGYKEDNYRTTRSLFVSEMEGALELPVQTAYQRYSGDYIPRGVYRYRLFAEHYMIVYQIEDDTVYADYVLDCRQDYGWLLR